MQVNVLMHFSHHEIFMQCQKSHKTILKFGLELFLMFLKTFLMLTKAEFIWSKNTVKAAIFWNIITI